ncbi:OPT superfamily [Sorochytrium milnesiophthora]
MTQQLSYCSVQFGDPLLNEVLNTPHVYNSTGDRIDAKNLVDPKTFTLVEELYTRQQPFWISPFFACACCYDKDIWTRFRYSRMESEADDIHCQLIDKYPTVPNLWYAAWFVIPTVIGIVVCHTTQIDMPWYLSLLTVFVTFLSSIPFAVIQATSGVQLATNVISESGSAWSPGFPSSSPSFNMHISVLILALLALVMQVATKRIDLGNTVSIESKPAGIKPNQTVSTQWELVNNASHIYCGIVFLPKRSESFNLERHQLFVTAPGTLLIGKLTTKWDKIYAEFCMAMEHGGPPQDCASPIELTLGNNERDVTFSLDFIGPADQPNFVRQVERLYFDKQFSITESITHVRTTQEIAGPYGSGEILLNAKVMAFTIKRDPRHFLCNIEEMRPATVDVEPYLAPNITAIDCKSDSTSSLALRMANNKTKLYS